MNEHASVYKFKLTHQSGFSVGQSGRLMSVHIQLSGKLVRVLISSLYSLSFSSPPEVYFGVGLRGGELGEKGTKTEMRGREEEDETNSSGREETARVYDRPA